MYLHKVSAGYKLFCCWIFFYGQKEDYHNTGLTIALIHKNRQLSWYFGEKACIDFRKDTAVFLSDPDTMISFKAVP